MAANKTRTVFDDEDFLDHLVNLLAYDADTLRQVAHLLKVDDFKPAAGSEWGSQRWIVAGVVLDHYKKHHIPIRDMLRSSVIDYVRATGLSVRVAKDSEDYLKRLRALSACSAEDVISKILRYKSELAKAHAIEELRELQISGDMTDEKWMDITRRAVLHAEDQQVSDYFETLSERIERRAHAGLRQQAPWFFIDPLDQIVRGAGRGQVGIIVAPPKRGKSLFLQWLAAVFPLQHFKVLFITMEDPKPIVEDRLDSAITAVAFHNLNEKRSTLRRRFDRYRRLCKEGLRIYDGTANGFTLSQIEQIYVRERDSGFHADALIVDYDAEIVPEKKFSDKVAESDDAYRRKRRMAAKHDIIYWTAAQTRRGTEHLKIITGSDIAEDYGKIRKSAIAISMGQGEYDEGDNGIYLHVMAHKFDRKNIGCNILADKERMMIFDREATRRAALRYTSATEDTEEGVYT